MFGFVVVEADVVFFGAASLDSDDWLDAGGDLSDAGDDAADAAAADADAEQLLHPQQLESTHHPREFSFIFGFKNVLFLTVSWFH